jgi:hypothetical protein
MEESLLVVTQQWYQELVKRAAQNPHAAMRLFLVNACLEVLKDQSDSEEELLVKALDRLGIGIDQALPGGWSEFRNYMPEFRRFIEV